MITFVAGKGYSPIPSQDARAPRHTLERFARVFRQCADELRQEVKRADRPRQLSAIDEHVIVRAMRSLYEAMDLGVIVPVFPLGENQRCLFADTFSDGSLVRAWRFAAIPLARYLRPSAFGALAGKLHFPVPKKNSRNQVLASDGKRARHFSVFRTVFYDNKTKQQRIGAHYTGEVAYHHHDYDERAWMIHNRIVATDDADALGVFADVVEEQLRGDPETAAAPIAKILPTLLQIKDSLSDLKSADVETKKPKPAGRPGEHDPKKDAKLYLDWQAAKVNGSTREEFAKARGIELSGLNRTIDRHTKNVRRGRIGQIPRQQK